MIDSHLTSRASGSTIEKRTIIHNFLTQASSDEGLLQRFWIYVQELLEDEEKVETPRSTLDALEAE
jgi:hypothetical protein